MKNNSFLAAGITAMFSIIALIIGILFTKYTELALELVIIFVGSAIFVISIRGFFMFVKESLDNRASIKENKQ